MNNIPPYEEQDARWSEGLPLPDADAAWQDMNTRLDRDERKRRFLPPMLPGCTGWALLLAGLAGAATWLLWPGAGKDQRSATKVMVARPPAKQPATPANNALPDVVAKDAPGGLPAGQAVPNPFESSDHTDKAVATTSTTKPTTESSDRISTGSPEPAAPATKPAAIPASVVGKMTAGKHHLTTQKNSREKTGLTENDRTRRSNTGNPSDIKGSITKAIAMKSGKNKTRAVKESIASKGNNTVGVTGAPSAGDAGNKNGAPASIGSSSGMPKKDSSTLANGLKAKPDSSLLTKQDPPKADSSSVAATVATPPKKRAKHGPDWSAGIALHQALAIGGQQVSAENYHGKANLLSEHIPSFYLRATKGHWFIQAEARFNAPQLMPSFNYAEHTRYDTAAHGIETVRQSLRKAWYHQFGATLNLEPLPRWSIGAGMQWSLLYRAAGERTIYRRDLTGLVTQSTVSTELIPGYRDSFLFRSQWQLLLQTEYRWRRWGLGLRYRKDLEPFIRFTRPDGAVVDKSNDAFEAILRLRIWESKRRKH